MIKVFYGEKTITIPKDSNFLDLKQKIFFKDKKLVKFFSFGGKKLGENLRVFNFPEFLISMDQSEYEEFTKGKFRCKRCRKYLKVSKMICNHFSKCRIFFNFKLKKPLTNDILGGYKEENDESEEEEIDQEEINREVNAQINEIFEKHKRYMRKKINDLLYNN